MRDVDVSGAIDVLGIDNVLFAVGDLDEAVAFYGDTLGLRETFRFPSLGIVGYRLGEEPPGLVIRADGRAPAPMISSPRAWLEVRDARATARWLEDRGVDAMGPPFEIATGWTVEIADSWGNVLGFTDYTKAPERGRAIE